MIDANSWTYWQEYSDGRGIVHITLQNPEYGFFMSTDMRKCKVPAHWVREHMKQHLKIQQETA